MNDFAKIDVSGLTPQILRDQPAPQLIWVDLDDLVIDRRYQREVTSAGRMLIKRIAAEFDWSRCAPILLAALPGGGYAIVDGQHRAHAAALCGITSLPAMVVPMSLQQQAHAFTAVNCQRVSVSPQAVYRAALAAGLEWAISCRAAVEAAGCAMATSNPTSTARKARVIYVTGLIKKMVSAGEASAVTAGLAGVVGSEQRDELATYEGRILAVWLPAIASNQRFLKLNLSDAFDAIDIQNILDDCHARARQLGRSARDLAKEHVRRELAELVGGI